MTTELEKPTETNRFNQKVGFLHLEDNRAVRISMCRLAKSFGKTYCSASSQFEWDTLLESGLRAKIYFVDISYPMANGGQVERNVHFGVASVRKHDPRARIFLYSADFRIKETAAELGVGYYKEGDRNIVDLFR